MGSIKHIIDLNIYMHTRPHEKICVACIRLEASILMPLSWLGQSAKRECGLICWVDAWFHMYVTLMSNVYIWAKYLEFLFSMLKWLNQFICLIKLKSKGEINPIKGRKKWSNSHRNRSTTSEVSFRVTRLSLQFD